MPRLLLVDDNPSIHKIAETLLSSSSIDLVCVASGSEAMMLLDSGERFDVALLDTVMPGMDGWELLSRMRKHTETAFIPIAMMAGVLDTVDPNQLSHAPIQGFLKKPIELRELADRVQQLLATPVTLADHGDTGEEPSVLSPFSTVPGTKISSLPEFREAVSDDAVAEDDLLVLTPEDFWPGEAVPEVLESVSQEAPSPFADAAVAALMEEVPPSAPPPVPVQDLDSALDLEELDLEALKDIHLEVPPALEAAPVAAVIPAEEPMPATGVAPVDEIPVVPEGTPPSEAAFAPPELPAPEREFEEEIEASLPTVDLSEQETLAIPGLVEGNHEFAGLPDLGDMPDFESVVSPAHPPEPLPEPPKPAPEPPPQREELAFPSPPIALGVPLASPAPSSAAVEEGVHPEHAALAQALLSDPALLDALAKAVVGRLGDQVLREIAWEVMPELAEKLPR